MATKPSIFITIECEGCNNLISYLKVEEGQSAGFIMSRAMDQYCPSCYEQQKKQTEGMT